MDYTCETYNKFMQGADLFEEEDADYLNSLSELFFFFFDLPYFIQRKHTKNSLIVLCVWFSESVDYRHNQAILANFGT